MPSEYPALAESAVTEAAPLHDVTLSLGEKGSLTFRVADAPGAPLAFCLGVRKSGSTLLNKIVVALARRNAMNTVDIPGTFFRSGMTVADWGNSDLAAVIRPGNVYIGFRTFPASFEAYESFRSARKVFMFRDPRDALVSQYFSDAYSHSLPSRETETGRKAAEAFEAKRAEALASDVESYVLKHARSMNRTLMAYAGMLNDPTCLTLRYEDYVFQKRRMIHKILQHFAWQYPPGALEALHQGVDEVPEAEVKTRFVRQVVPGDHRRKLSPVGLRRLNNVLAESLATFDYY
jgi:hypothetical protein